MNDSKRSNIVLPRFVIKSGFRLLLKPAYNFPVMRLRMLSPVINRAFHRNHQQPHKQLQKSQFEALNEETKKNRVT